MPYRKITAIVHVDSLSAVEEAMKHVGATEVVITRVEGYGDYKNFYNPDWMSSQARIEAFISAAQADAAVESICRAAHTGQDSDGMVAVLPVENLLHIKEYVG